jgi:hypothetical protein
MASSEAMLSATSTGLCNVVNSTPATPVISPASAARRARNGTNWSCRTPSLR